MGILRFVILLGLMMSAKSFAMSFDCKTASTFAETQICKDGYLVAMDSSMASAYKHALEATGELGALRESQVQWLDARNQCANANCLGEALRLRILALQKFERDDFVRKQDAAKEQGMAQQRAEDAAQAQRAEQYHAAQKAADEQAARQRSNSTMSSSVNRATQQPINPVGATASDGDFIGDIITYAWKFIVLIAIFCTIWSIFRHHREQTTIYFDYSDAALNNALPGAGLIVGLIGKWLGMPDWVYQVSLFTGIVLAACLAVYAAMRINRGALNVFLSLVARLTFITVFYAVIIFLVLSFFVRTKRDYENQVQADARNRREKKETRVLLAATTVGYTFLTAWLCRYSGFTPLAECLEYDR